MISAGRFRVTADHPSLMGHFPGRPIVPGVVLLDELFAVVASVRTGRVTSLPSVKFLAPVLPDQDVLVLLDARSGSRLAFECTFDGRCVLRGTLLLEDAA